MIASDLVVLVRAKTDKLGGDLNKSKTLFSDFSKGFGKGGLLGSIIGGTAIGTIIGGAISSLASYAAEAARAFYEMAKGQAEAIDTTTKLSYQLGIDTQTLQAMQISADMANVSVESFQKGMIKMRDNAVAAVQGNDQMAAAFARLGLSAKNIVSLPVDKQFGVISDAVRAMGGNVQAQSAIIDIFGKNAGPELYTMLLEGSKGVEEMKGQLERLGITFDNVQGNQVEAMNDAMRMILESFYGVGRVIAIDAAPYVKYFADKLLNVIERMGGVKHIIDVVIESIKIFAKAFTLPLRVFAEFHLMFVRIAYKIVDAIADIIDEISELARMLPEQLQLVDPNNISEGAKALRDFTKTGREGVQAVSDFLNPDKWFEDFANIEEGSRRTAEAADATRRNFASWGGEIDAATEKMKALRDVSPSGEALKGSKAAYSAIASAQREGAKTELKAIEKNGKEQIGVLRQIDKSINKISIPTLQPANL